MNLKKLKYIEFASNEDNANFSSLVDYGYGANELR